MQKEALVSIITPVFNGVTYIETCIQSVLKQTYPMIEHIIVDAGSTDGTSDIIRAYRDQYPARIRFISEPDNGPGDGWNKGLKMANGDIFGCLGYDDLYLPDTIETVIDFFNSNPDAHFLHGDCDIINAAGEIIKKHKTEPFDYLDFANTARHISTVSAFYKREVMVTIGWLDSSGDDFDVMLRITKNYTVHRIEKTLSKLRVHESYFNPKDFKKRSNAYHQTYLVSRKYGGQVFSPLAMRYYISVLIRMLHLDFAMPLIRTIVNKRLQEPR